MLSPFQKHQTDNSG